LRESYLVQLLSVKVHTLKVSDFGFLQPFLDLLNLVDASTVGVKFFGDVQIRTRLSLESRDKVGEHSLILLKESDSLLTVLPSIVGLASVAQHFLLFAFELEVNTQVHTTIRRSVNDMERRRQLAQDKGRNANLLADNKRW